MISPQPPLASWLLHRKPGAQSASEVHSDLTQYPTGSPHRQTRFSPQSLSRMQPYRHCLPSSPCRRRRRYSPPLILHLPILRHRRLPPARCHHRRRAKRLRARTRAPSKTPPSGCVVSSKSFPSNPHARSETDGLESETRELTEMTPRRGPHNRSGMAQPGTGRDIRSGRSRACPKILAQAPALLSQFRA